MKIGSHHENYSNPKFGFSWWDPISTDCGHDYTLLNRLVTLNSTVVFLYDLDQIGQSYSRFCDKGGRGYCSFRGGTQYLPIVGMIILF